MLERFSLSLSLSLIIFASSGTLPEISFRFFLKREKQTKIRIVHFGREKVRAPANRKIRRNICSDYERSSARFTPRTTGASQSLAPESITDNAADAKVFRRKIIYVLNLLLGMQSGASQDLKVLRILDGRILGDMPKRPNFNASL